ncbi:MMPL family transporter [Streptomyces phaeochromogenes]|uniref:MMPL family transporter n=1 Tax=Streptomyces phaeochromogenes TaxID=1923 RepID=UPI0033F9E953
MPSNGEPAAPTTPLPPGRGQPEPLIERVAAWSARRRKTALFGWLIFVVLTFAVGAAVGGKGPQNHDPGESGRAQVMIEDAGDDTRPPSENVLVQAGADSPGFGTDTALQKAVQDVGATLNGLTGKVSDVVVPTTAEPGGLVSADGRSVLVTFSLAGSGHGWDNAAEVVEQTQQRMAQLAKEHKGLTIVQAGDASVDFAVEEATSEDFATAELTSIPLTLVILLVVFGALIAAGIPLLLAVTAVVAAMGLLTLAANWLPVDDTASSVVLLVGMAVGVDYTLFYLRREREERLAGRDTEQALRITAATSGRAVVVSGLTVAVSMAGLFLTGIDTFTGMAVGTIAVVLLAVVGSLTALPAVLSMLGSKVDGLRLPWIGRRRAEASSSRVWTAVVAQVVRRPLLWGGAAVAALLLAALPAAGMRLADPGLQERFPDSVPEISHLVAIQEAFPGKPAPAQVVVTGSALDTGAFDEAVTALREQVAKSGGALAEPVRTAKIGDGGTVVVTVPLAGSGNDAESQKALKLLRDTALPRSLGEVDGLRYAVTGQTAGPADMAAALDSRTPVVFAFVLVFAFLLLVSAFRSLAIPLVSIALNVLSIGAAYGVVTLVFQDGHLSGLLGFESYGGIISWLPLFMFVILFGLSMDYHVFIISRIRELRMEGADTRTAVTRGIGGSAGVVTSAAVVMIAVFSIFASLSMLDYKMLGLGMAVAILVDATLVRGVLLPAALALLGDRSWTLPRALAWIPAVAAERSPEPPAAAHEEAAEDSRAETEEDRDKDVERV